MAGIPWKETVDWLSHLVEATRQAEVTEKGDCQRVWHPQAVKIPAI